MTKIIGLLQIQPPSQLPQEEQEGKRKGEKNKNNT